MSGYDGILSRGVLTADDLVRFREFSCGAEEWHHELQAFLHENALREGAALFNKTYVFYDDANAPVAYAALSAAQVSKGGSSQALDGTPYVNLPALLIGRLAVDERFHGKGIGSTILGRIRQIAAELPIGCRFLALHVDRRNETAIGFYERQGFIRPPLKPRDEILFVYDLAEPDIVPED